MLRAFQWDIARQVERLDVLLKLLPRYADWGYEELYLHLEDAIEYPSLPGVARADAYTQRQIGRLVETAARHGIRTVPIVNLLGHTQYLVKTAALRDLNELRAPDGSPLERGQICPLHPEILGVAEKLLHDTAPFCSAGKVHVGLDESFHLGKCPRCRAEIAARGLAAHFAGHVDRLHTLTAARGLRLGLWADMLNFIPSAIARLPRDVIAYDWYYYPFARHPRVELFNFIESDLATPLRARGIDYWGCPMNGAFRYEPLPLFKDRLANLRSWWRRCVRTQAAGFLVTSWEAYRLALETTTVVDAAAASLWLDPHIAEDDHAMLTRGFARVFGRSGAAGAARAALAADAQAFAGYARWEINERWDVRAPHPTVRTPVSPRPRVRKKNLPAPLADSLAFLSYLNCRDDFVTAAAAGVFTLRRTLSAAPAGNRQAGTAGDSAVAANIRALEHDARTFSQELRQARRSARAMWVRTRAAAAPSQNAAILAADAARLRDWRRWLQKARRDASTIFEASPVCGRWQLLFTVVNIAPALQKIVVEQRGPEGAWRELHARHTIEFRAEAARRRTRISRPFSVAVEDPAAPLRIVLRGLGRVAIRDLVLTDGVTVLHPKRWAARVEKILGQPAPRRGFPDITRTRGLLPLVFR